MYLYAETLGIRNIFIEVWLRSILALTEPPNQQETLEELFLISIDSFGCS